MDAGLIFDPPAEGVWNMAFDEALLERAAADGSAWLRFYLWQEPTLSLGYFQQAADRDQHAASQSCPLVRRSTGGGAIVHDAELTYSFVMRQTRQARGAAVEQLYGLFHESLVETLARWNLRAHLWSAQNNGGDGPAPFLCFQRRAEGDVVLNDVKVAGSAQRRYRDAVLQHGSVLLAASPRAPELPGIGDLTPISASAVEMRDQWLVRLRQKLEFGLIRRSVPHEIQQRARELVNVRFGASSWNQKR